LHSESAQCRKRGDQLPQLVVENSEKFCRKSRKILIFWVAGGDVLARVSQTETLDTPAQQIMLEQLIEVLRERGWQQFITILGVPIGGEWAEATGAPYEDSLHGAIDYVDTILRCFIGLDEDA
jgi:hypothetical protein